MKGLSVVLIGMLGAKWAIAYVAADLGLFLVIKIARKDLYYWIPLDGWTLVVCSFLLRVIIKVVVDFTSIGEIIMFCTQQTSVLIK